MVVIFGLERLVIISIFWLTRRLLVLSVIVSLLFFFALANVVVDPFDTGTGGGDGCRDGPCPGGHVGIDTLE
jgi:hypothetical protein